MVFSREINNQCTGRVSKEIWLTKADFSSNAARGIVFEHCRISLFELLSHSFAHYANAIHSIHQSLGFAGEKIPYECLEHSCCSYLLSKKHGSINGSRKVETVLQPGTGILTNYVCSCKKPRINEVRYQNLSTLSRTMSPISNRIVPVSPVHCKDIIEVKKAKFPRMKKPRVSTRSFAIGN